MFLITAIPALSLLFPGRSRRLFFAGAVAEGFAAFGFDAAADLPQPAHFAGGAEFLGAGFFAMAGGALPAIKYFRILSRCFLPTPRMASKSSTLLNGPYDLRMCKILLAVTGPIPGTCCKRSESAALMLIGCAGGFFVVATTLPVEPQGNAEPADGNASGACLPE
jgi:hypothetical protein